MTANLDAERSLLGSVMHGVDRATLLELLARVPDDAWSRRECATVWQAVRRCADAGTEPDECAVIADLQSRGELQSAGGATAVARLSEYTPTAANVRHHAGLVLEAHKRRELAAMADTLAAAATDQSVSLASTRDTMARFAAQMAADGARRPKRVSEVMSGAIDALEARYKAKGALRGETTGYADIDALLGGFKPGELVLAAARPGMGKSALALEIARRSRVSTMMVSAEMSTEQQVDRLLVAEARVDATRYRDGRIADADWPRLGAAAGRLMDLPLWILEASALSDVRAAAAEHAAAGGKLLVVDYLQLIRTGMRHGRIEEVSEVARAHKEIAMDHGMTVLALAQLNRECEKREDKRPMLSDLRESGELEQAADVVAMLYRQAYYDPEAEPVAELQIKKNRTGATGDVLLVWQPQFQRFEPAEKNSNQP
jgi:replicative DNA helicase